MAIERVINYVVAADGKITCNGSRRPQIAGVQGDDRVCALNFDVSAIYSESAHYFFEFVCGGGTPVILSDEDDGVTFNADTKTLSVVLPQEITSEGGRVEVCIVEEVLDEESNSAIEGSTYVTYIKLEAKSGVMARLKSTAYGIFLECKNLLERALSVCKDSQKSYSEAQAVYEELSDDINKVNTLEQIPRNIKVWLDTTSYDKPTVMISCDVLDKFLDPTVAENTSYRLPIEVSKDRIGNHTVYLNSNLSAEFLWSLSEIKYSDSIAVCCYQIELTGAGEPIPIIRHFYPYSNESMLEQYILPLEAKIDSKKDMFHIAETSSLIDESDEYGNSFLNVKIDYSTLQKDGNGCIAVNTDVIADKDYVNSLVSGAVKRKVVEQLPTENIDLNTIYMVLADVQAENNIYNEFMYINEKWEQIGSTAVDLSGYATLDDLETKENKLVGGNAITISEVENAGEKRTVVSVYGVVMQGQYNADMAKKAKKSKLEPIRTVIIGDETTYQDADIISYSDEEATQVQKIAICVDNNGKPFHLKETWIKSYLPSRTDTTSNYKFVCFPYTFVDLNSSGMPSSAAGMKLCNHIVEVSTLTTEYCNQCYTKFDDEANAYYGFDTGNYARSSVDAMTTWKSWGVNPKMIQDNAWGNTQRSVMCNGALVSSKPEDVPLATGTKIEIYGVRKDED